MSTRESTDHRNHGDLRRRLFEAQTIERIVANFIAALTLSQPDRA